MRPNLWRLAGEWKDQMEFVLLCVAFAVGYLAGRLHSSYLRDRRIKPQGGGGPGEEGSK